MGQLSRYIYEEKKLNNMTFYDRQHKRVQQYPAYNESR